MRLPKTSRRWSEVQEVRLGNGEYAAGGSRSPPFLDLDDARRRRPLVFGEVTDDLDGYPDLAAEMFSGRQTDVFEWAMMWKEVGADGICLRLSDTSADEAVALVLRMRDGIRLPIFLDADRDICSGMSAVDGFSLMFRDAVGGHVRVSVPEHADDGCIVEFPPYELDSVVDHRRRGLEGEDGFGQPILVDVTGSWDDIGDGDDARTASMKEALLALEAMLSGADMIVVRGPGAADMARVYGEELADL